MNYELLSSFLVGVIATNESMIDVSSFTFSDYNRKNETFIFNKLSLIIKSISNSQNIQITTVKIKFDILILFHNFSFVKS